MKLSNIENTLLSSLVEGFKTKMPFEAIALFLPRGGINEHYEVGYYPYLSNPDIDKNILISKNSFVHNRAKNYLDHEFISPIFHTKYSNWKKWELNSLEEILNYWNIEKNNVKGVIDFVFPIRKIPIVGLLVNPLDAREGVISRKVVSFTDKDLRRLNDFLHSYYERAIDIEKTASELKVSFYEEKISAPEIKNFFKEYEVDGFSKPVGGKVGGDFVFSTMKNDEVLYFLGDISGHSIKESVLNNDLRKVLLTLTLKKIPSLEELIGDFNEMFFELRDQEAQFVTFFGIKLCKDGNFEYSSSGHKAYLLRNNNYETLESTQAFLGSEKNLKCVGIREKFNRGECLFVWTDGISETTNSSNEILGDEKVLEYLIKNKTEDLSLIKNGLEKYVKSFSSDNINDDISFLGIRYNGIVM